MTQGVIGESHAASFVMLTFLWLILAPIWPWIEYSLDRSEWGPVHSFYLSPRRIGTSKSGVSSTTFGIMYHQTSCKLRALGYSYFHSEDVSRYTPVPTTAVS